MITAWIRMTGRFFVFGLFLTSWISFYAFAILNYFNLSTYLFREEKCFGSNTIKTSCKSPREIIAVDSEEDVIRKLCSTIEEIANDAIKARDQFRVGLSGGSLVGFLTKGLPNIKTDWSKWVLAFCDERVVPFGDQDSTFGVYSKALCDNGLLKKEQFIVIDPSLGVDAAAKDYAAKLAAVFPSPGLPQFDALLLGMGPDGHTCSLFPEHPGLEVTNLWVAPIENSPKPPPNRVTLTFPVINNALNCIFALTGQGKAEMVKKILKDQENLPAGMVLPTKGKVLWFLDKPAASLL